MKICDLEEEERDHLIRRRRRRKRRDEERINHLKQDQDKMAEENVPAPDPTKSDEQILPFNAWLPVGKGNLLLDLQRLQKKIDAKTEEYSFQLDEQWFILNVDLLRKALEITPVNSAHPFVSPPAGEQVMDFVNKLGYLEEIHFVSKMHVNNLYQPWRAILGIVTRSNVDYAELLWEECVQAIQIFFVHQANLNIPTKKPTYHVIPYYWFTKLIIFYLGSEHNIHKTPGSPVHVTGDDFLLGNLKFVPKGEKDEYLEMVARKPTTKEGGQKKTSSVKEIFTKPALVKKHAPAKQTKPVKEIFTKPATSTKAIKGKVLKVRKGKRSDRLVDEEEEEPQPDPEPQIEDDEYNLQRGIQMSLESFQAPVSGVAIREPTLGITRSLPIVEGKGKGIATDEQAAQSLLELQQPKKKITTINTFFRDAEIGADTEKSNSEGDTKILNAGSNPGQGHVALAGPNPKPMHEDFVVLVYPQVHESLKHTDEEHVHLENPLSSSGTLSSIKNLDDAFTFVSPPTQEHVFTTTTATITTSLLLPPPPPQQQSTTDPVLAARVLALEQICANFEKKNKVHDQTTQALSSRIFTLENHDLELSEFDMKEVLHDRMFESGSYRSQPEHAALYEALEESMDRENREVFVEATAKSQDIGVDHLPKIKTRPDWLKPILEEETPKTPKPDWVIPPNDLPKPKNNWMEECHLLLTDHIDLVNPEGNRVVADVSKPLPLGGPLGNKERRNALSISKLKAAYYQDFRLEELVPSLWIESEREYDISAAYCILHWWFKRKEFYITRHSAPSNRRVVRSHIKILSVVSLKTFSRYGYTFLREIVLHRADYKEYKISEADFKNLHPNDFEDLYLLHLQGNLNHLSESDKLGIENYQTKLNLTQPSWDATDFLFKEDYTIFSKPRAIIYKDRNNQKKMMRESEVHQFSDGTLTRILEQLDHMVKDYVMFKFNPGMEHIIWFEDDKRRSKEFIEVIKRRLKIQRIFKNLESFVSGRLRDVDYRLIQRTE
ncbi:hypothetical protein Tco_1032134 [Tanacetum coccineum]|uniref:Uncharacterized protein n=1 Tax=Tanacetum coccineum TaxID=301880 RepID=A0ABQ5GCN5_9ASTR